MRVSGFSLLRQVLITDLPMRGNSYATEGVEHFVSEVLKMDNTDFVGKMEGFAVQGLRGMPRFKHDNILTF